MVLNPSTYLTSQGWDGPGTALKKGGIKKPVTVAHKTNLKGIGKERDTGYAWWDDVFSMVASKKVGGQLERRRAELKDLEQAGDIKRTSTGIYSPLPPASGSSTPVGAEAGPSTSTGSAFHSDIIGQAKLEAARRELYSKFLRGRPLNGTVEDKKEPVEQPDKEQRRADKLERKRLRQEKRERKAARKGKQREEQRASEEDTDQVAAPGEANVEVSDTVDMVEETQKKEKKSRKRASDDEHAEKNKKSKKNRKLEPEQPEHAPVLPTPPPTDSEQEVTSRKTKKKNRKHS